MTGSLKVGVFVDAQNVRYNGGYNMRYDVLRRFAGRGERSLLRLNTYVAFDPQTLEPLEDPVVVPRETPPELHRPRIELDGVGVKIADDLGESGSPEVKYVLRWETLPAHHDRPREGPLPPPSVLELVRLERSP